MYESAGEFTPDPLPVKWLRNLFYIHIASTALSLISMLPIPDGWTVWVSRAISVAAIVCLFQLTPAQQRYKKAFLYRTVTFVLVLIHDTRFGSLPLLSFLLLASSVCSIIAQYQEYHGHGDLIREQDPKLADKWHSLFMWQVVFSVLITFAASFLAVLVSMLMGSGTDVASTIVMVITQCLSLALEVVYLVYLNRTIHLVQA